MEELEYWRLKAQFMQLMIEENQLQDAIRDVHNRRNLLMLANNLKGNLRFDDVAFTIEEIKNG